MGAATLENSLVVSFLMLHKNLVQESSVLLLGIYPREVKIQAHMKTQALMFTATLFKIAKNVNNSNAHELVNG